ncbi:MAG TPA: prolyl oligopeptidase family serine peptidase [Pyrinomonadaceae bacterium]
MTSFPRIILCLIVSSVFLPSAVHTQSLTQKRKLQVDDVLNLYQIGRGFGGPIAFSPDGKQLAFVIQRPQLSAALSAGSLLGNDRADVWVLPSPVGQPINITNGLHDQAGYFAPAWSPDGTRLAMLSTKGGNIHICVWEAMTQKLRQVSTLPIDVYSVVDRPFVWVNSHMLLANVLDANMISPRLLGDLRVTETAVHAWAKTREGRTPSVSVLSSGRQASVSPSSDGQLVAINVDDGTVQTIWKKPARKVLVSPDRNKFAFVTKVQNYQFDPSRPLPYEDWEGRCQLDVISVKGQELLTHDLATLDVIPTSLTWSPDGEELAFLTYTSPTSPNPVLTVFDVANQNTILSPDNLKLRIDGREPPQLLWTRDGWLAMASSNPQTNRNDWWLFQEHQPPRCTTCEMKTPPFHLLSETRNQSFVGIADEDLWRISPNKAPQNLTQQRPYRITSITWPQAEWRPDKTQRSPANTEYNELIVATKPGLFRVDLIRNQFMPIALPAMNATVIGRSTATETTVYSSNGDEGLCVWLSANNTQPRQIFAGNGFLKTIKPATQRLIEYRSTNGEPLKGWIMLPPDYKPGAKYPLLVYVYPISYLRPFDRISDPIYLNLQIASAQGYAVLCPTIPFTVEGPVDDPLLKLTSGVLPAVEKAIELGIADPDRLFVMGHSLGGFAAFGLVTQTDRFKAAIALGGLTNLISGWGQFDTASRYDESPNERASNQAFVIESALSLRSPPWQDLDRYLRNSPIRYVDKVQTPLMIIQGDLDTIPIEQGEEFFMALQKQGKRAEFVRYWGEGHVFQSPANIRDMWQRIFAWFEEFSPKLPNGSSTKPLMINEVVYSQVK